jgi:uncharacterized membrane protein HdeD (DUF308 family)
MSNGHQEKYISKLLFGFSLIIGSVFVIVFAAFERTRQDDWYFWGLVASVLMCFGLYLLLSAFVHKMKSDLIKRQRSREQQKTRTDD